MLRLYPYITSNLGTIDDMHRALRVYMLHPATILVFCIPPLFKALDYMPIEFPVLGLWGDILFYILRICLFYVIALRFEGIVFYWGMKRNLPFTYTTLGFWLVFMGVNFVTLHWLLLEDPQLWVEAWKLARLLIYSTFYHFFLMWITRRDLLPILGKDPRLVPYFWPVKDVQKRIASAALIDGDLAGDVLSLQAQNQYVRVETTQGGGLVRTTLRAAIDRLPPESGLQIHRSWWVAMTEVEGASFDRDRAELTSPAQRSYPVGVTYQAAVLGKLGAE